MSRRALLRWVSLCVAIHSLAWGWVAPHAAQASTVTARLLDTGPASYVNPFVGTAGEGATFPGADAPFGMVQWSPDTPGGGPGGYSYDASTITGFSLTHLSGTGCFNYQNVPFMPTTSPLTVSPALGGAYSAGFSHSNEQASPGYYSVQLDSGIGVSLTVTPRSGLAAITYPATTTAHLLISTTAGVRIVGDDTVEGSAVGGGFCGAANTFTVYFAAQFSQPFVDYGTWNGATLTPDATSADGTQSGAYVSFDTTQGDRTILVKVGVSFVSVQNALLNAQTENPGWDFAAVHSATTAAWNALLGRIAVDGGSPEDTETFYTALYHALLHPNVFSDVNGQYIGFDDNIHATQGYTRYATYSGWDIYRSEIPLLAVLAPQQTGDMMQSLLNDAEQGGSLPRWALANADTGIMVGDPADPILADAYAFGATHFDAHEALQEMLHGATVTRAGLGDYLSLGYVGLWTLYGAASTTLEDTTADFSIAQLAQALGDTTTYQTYMQRAQYWQNLLNPGSGYIQPRLSDGTFLSGFDPLAQWGYEEGDAAQYTWMVPYNLHALFTALGGDGQVVARLDSLVSQLNAGPDAPYVWLGNEPSLAIPWEYDFAGAPWRTQAVVRQAITSLYNPTPAGLPGNDDLGELSSWYVWATLGLYPEIPGVGELVLGSPLFPSSVIHLAGGHDITITAAGASDGAPYVQDLTVNGQGYAQPWLPFAAITNGATLQFTLGSTANTT